MVDTNEIRTRLFWADGKPSEAAGDVIGTLCDALDEAQARNREYNRIGRVQVRSFQREVERADKAEVLAAEYRISRDLIAEQSTEWRKTAADYANRAFEAKAVIERVRALAGRWEQNADDPDATIEIMYSEAYSIHAYLLHEALDGTS